MHVIISSARLNVHYLDSLGLLSVYYAAVSVANSTLHVAKHTMAECVEWLIARGLCVAVWGLRSAARQWLRAWCRRRGCGGPDPALPGRAARSLPLEVLAPHPGPQIVHDFAHPGLTGVSVRTGSPEHGLRRAVGGAAARIGGRSRRAGHTSGCAAVVQTFTSRGASHWPPDVPWIGVCQLTCRG